MSVQAYGSYKQGKMAEFQYILCVGSSRKLIDEGLHAFAFQYILCVGSRSVQTERTQWQHCFNTSYVSVQVAHKLNPFAKGKPFQYILCVGSSLFALFAVGYFVEFQYILCVGSSKSSSNFLRPKISFQYILCVGSRLFK